MHALGGSGKVFLSAAAIDFGKGGGKETIPCNLTFKRKSTEVNINFK
jgi:hypothetical protein